jgi:8-oxo-dGTP diphosphatase
VTEPRSAFPSLQTGRRPNVGVAGILLRHSDPESYLGADIGSGQIHRVNIVRREIYLIQRTGSHGEGTWSVPGGWIEHFEGPDLALKRELWEEVGVTVVEAEFVNFTWNVFAEGIESFTLWYKILECEGEPRNSHPSRILDSGWKDLSKLPHPLFPAMQNAVDLHIVDASVSI